MPNIAFLKSPAPLNLTGNPISVRVAGKNAFTGNLTKASQAFCIQGSTPWAVDTYLRFEYGGKTITFYCRTSPSDSLLEFPSLIQYSELVGYLKKSAELMADYEIDYNVGAITLWARNLGEQYNLDITSDWVPGFAAFPAVDNTEHLLADFYKIGINVEKNTKVIRFGFYIYELLAKSEFPVSPPDDNDSLPGGFTETGTGVMQTNIADLLKEEASGNFTFPEPDEGFHADRSDLINDFRVYAYEKLSGDDIGIFSSTYRYMQGKLSPFRQGELNYLEKTVYDLLSESKMFLTWAPLEKKTDIYAPEKLYFLFITAGTYRLVSKEYYDDDTVSTTIRETITPSAYALYEFFVSYVKIRTNAPKHVIKYDIYLINQYDAYISDVRTFVIDYTYQAYARYFFLKNSFGVYELVRTTGKVTKNLAIAKDFINVPLPDDYVQTDSEKKQLLSNAETTYKINSGYLPDKYWADWFMELLLSEETYWLKKGKAYPVAIGESKNQVSQDGDYNPYQEFELTHSIHDDFTEEFNTSEPIIIGDFNFDFNTDFFTGGTGEEPQDPSIIFEDEFDDWEGGMPVGWNKIGESTVVSENDGAVVIAFSSGDLYTSGKIIRPDAFVVADPPPGMNWMQVKVTINILSLSAGDQALVEFCQYPDGTGYAVQEQFNEAGIFERVMNIPMSFDNLQLVVVNMTGNTNHSVIIESIEVKDLYQYSYMAFP